MGSRGPTKLSASELASRGSTLAIERGREDRTDGLNDNSAPPYTPPAWLSEQATILWIHLERRLHHMLKDLDLDLLASYCETRAQYIEASLTVREQGLTITSPKTGELCKHPLLATLNAQRTALLRMGGEFGLSPSSRDRLGVVWVKSGE